MLPVHGVAKSGYNLLTEQQYSCEVGTRIGHIFKDEKQKEKTQVNINNQDHN